jgi:hypothetical protein
LREDGRRGFSIIYVGFVMLAAFAMVSLAVDLGRVRVGRLQLSTAADAAALAGVQKLPVPNVAQARLDSVNVAAQNSAVEGTGGATPVALDPNADVVFGLYRNIGIGTFTPLGSTEANGTVVDTHNCNACRVTAQRTATRSNAVGLYFARAINVNQVDVVGRATAWIRGSKGTGIGIVGLDWIKFNGTTATDSYDYRTGPYGGQNVHHGGTIGSNGTITLVGTNDIDGDARSGPNFPTNATNNVTVTGWTAPLDEPLDYPPVPYSPPPTNNNADNLPSKLRVNFDPKQSDLPLAIGSPDGSTRFRYVFNSFSMNGGTVSISAPCDIWVSGNVDIGSTSKLIIDATRGGSVTFYVNGNFNQGGNSSINNSFDPIALEINMTGSGTTFDCSSDIKAHIYAPLSDVTLHGNAQNPPADFWGWVIGKTLDIKGNCELHYDESRQPQGGPLHPVLIK